MSTAHTKVAVKRNRKPAAADEDPLMFARPNYHQRAREIQPYGTVVRYPLALGEKVRVESVGILNQVLAETMTLRDIYKKHHWRVSGLLEAHEMVLLPVRRGAERTAQIGDAGSNDLLVSQVLRTHVQVWFLSEHLIATPLTRAH